MWQPYLNVKRVLIGHTGEERSMVATIRKFLYHHNFSVGYNVGNVFYSAIKAAKAIWGLAPEKLYNCIHQKAVKCPFANILDLALENVTV